MFERSRRNLSYRLTLAMGGILVLFAGLSYYQEALSELGALDQWLYKKARIMAASADYQFRADRWQLDLEGVPLLGSRTLALESDLIYARWYNAEGQLVRFSGLPAPDALTGIPGFQTLDFDLIASELAEDELPEAPFRQLTLPVQQGDRTLGYLQVATSLAPVQASLQTSLLFLVMAVMSGVSAVGLTSWLFSGTAMQPVRQVHHQLERFTADAAHELRSPLSAILNNAEVGLMSESTPDKDRRLKTIADLTYSMSGLVTSLLVLAQHQSYQASASLPVVNLTYLLQDVIEDYTTRSVTQNLMFTSQLPDQPIVVKANWELLRHAVANLLNNAYQYTPAGGMVFLQLLTHQHWAIIRVEDTGIGIEAADLPHIFERFYRADREESRQTSGFGLGLAIAQQIVQTHGGQMQVSSTKGKGTLFQIELPLLDD